MKVLGFIIKVNSLKVNFKKIKVINKDYLL